MRAALIGEWQDRPPSQACDPIGPATERRSSAWRRRDSGGPDAESLRRRLRDRQSRLRAVRRWSGAKRVEGLRPGRHGPAPVPAHVFTNRSCRGQTGGLTRRASIGPQCSRAYKGSSQTSRLRRPSCITGSASYPSLLGSPTDSRDEADSWSPTPDTKSSAWTTKLFSVAHHRVDRTTNSAGAVVKAAMGP
jgi:hypothetical protein